MTLVDAEVAQRFGSDGFAAVDDLVSADLANRLHDSFEGLFRGEFATGVVYCTPDSDELPAEHFPLLWDGADS